MHADNAVDQVNTVLSCFLFIYLCLLPNYTYKFLRIFKHTLHEPEIKQSYNSLYLTVDYYKL